MKFRYLAFSIGAVLGVLLVLRVEVVDGIGHDVAGVHRLPERGGDAVHGHAPPDLACDWSVSLILASDWLPSFTAPAPHCPMYADTGKA